MKTSALIKYLQKTMKQYGDIDIVVFVPRKHASFADLNNRVLIRDIDDDKGVTKLLLCHTQSL